ncbi:hypothetical protein RUM43_009601 [Polyplax serrata]|uniref:Uncharacterized protein n=1 Tax=Polyplax serrata TaxID=468196 RepID=A0AAN8S2N1_POLSC
MEGTSITFEEVNRKYSGVYECEASNDFGTVRKSVEIHVHCEYLLSFADAFERSLKNEFLRLNFMLFISDAPEIEIEEETVTTAVGLQPEITCTVHAEPKANVTWYKNGDIVTKKNRISTTVVNNKYTLQITKMNEDDFGSYTCHAKNELGSKQKAIILSGAPTKPKFKLGIANDERSPEIMWTVESYQPVIEYEFQYKKLQDEKWTKMAPMQTVMTEGNIYSGKEVLTGLPPNDYQVRVRAKNSHGWSIYSEEMVFNGATPTLFIWFSDMAAGSTSAASTSLAAKTIVQILISCYVLYIQETLGKPITCKYGSHFTDKMAKARRTDRVGPQVKSEIKKNGSVTDVRNRVEQEAETHLNWFKSLLLLLLPPSLLR